MKTQDGQTLADIVVTEDDIYDIECTNSINNKIGFYSYYDEAGASNIGLSSTAYPKIRYRYKTSSSSIKAKILIVFDSWNPGLTEAQNIAAGNAQLILDNTSSTTWKTGVATITAGKTIDHVRLYANSAVGHVYYDFWMIYKGDFSLPNTKYGESFKPPVRLAPNESPGALGDEIQNLGNKSAIVDLGCDLDMGTWLRAGDTLRGQVFLDIAHNSPTESFQWIDLGDLVCQFKVIMSEPEWQNNASENEANASVHVVFYEYRRAPANSETVVERFGLDL